MCRKSQFFSAVSLAMFIIGVDIRSNSSTIKFKSLSLCSICQKIVALLWLVCIADSIAAPVMSFLPHANQRISTRLVSIGNGVTTLISLWILMSKQKNISSLLNNFCNLKCILKADFNQAWINAGAIVMVAIPVMLGFKSIVPMNEYQCKQFVAYYSLNLIDGYKGQYCIISNLFIVLVRFPIMFMMTAIAVFYILLCCLSRSILLQYITNGEKAANPDCRTLQHYLTTYEEILKVLRSLETTLSFPVLSAVGNNCAYIFWGFIALDPFAKTPYPIVKEFNHSIILSTFISLLSFLCVTLAASSVGDATKNAKMAQHKLMQRAIASAPKVDREEIVLLFTTHKGPSFTLTAWGFFTFTRGLILPALGSISTISLLILQMDSK